MPFTREKTNMEIWKICYVSRQWNLNYNFACQVFNLSFYIFKSRKIPMLRISYSARLTWQSTHFLLLFFSFSPTLPLAWLIKSHESSRDLNVCTRKAKHCCHAILTFHASLNLLDWFVSYSHVSQISRATNNFRFFLVHWHLVSKSIEKSYGKKIQIFAHLCIILCDFSQRKV